MKAGLMDSLRMRVVGAVAEVFRAADHPEPFASHYARFALDAVLDCLTENVDDVSDVMAKEVGDYWTHQTRRALSGLLAVLREDR